MRAYAFYARLRVTPLLDYFYWSLAALCLADWVLTIVGIGRGAHEVNPLFVFFGEMGLGIFASVSIGKVLQIVSFTLLWRFAKGQKEVWEWRLGFGMTLVLYCWVVSHNLSVIQG